MKLFSALLFIISAPAYAVTGGQSLTPTEAAYRTVVNIKMQNGMCSGAVVDDTVILAASHCRDLFGEAEFVALLNEGSTAECDVAQVVDAAFVPEAVRELPRRVHAPDLYLIRIAHKLCHSQNAVLSSTPITGGEQFWGAGHGAGNQIFGLAKKFKMQLIDRDLAAQSITPFDDVAEDFVGIGARTLKYALPVESGSSFCYGDSGGPVYRDGNGPIQIVAVNSAIQPNQALGSARCDQAYVQLIAPVAPYVAWIESKIAEWHTDPEMANLVQP